MAKTFIRDFRSLNPQTKKKIAYIKHSFGKEFCKFKLAPHEVGLPLQY